MFGKIEITGILEVRTGMHIGGSSAFAAIGAVDSPVVVDVRTNMPMIPGSSVKGKMRSLLAKEYNTTVAATPDDDCERLTRLFGSARKGEVKRSRVLISDMMMSNADALRKAGLQSLTEVKFENTINRITAVANPRQIERVVRGAQFDLDFIYELDPREEAEEFLEDMETLSEGFHLLEYDYLGGSGSRGYGKVQFRNVHADAVIGDITEDLMIQANEILNKSLRD